MKTIVSWSSGKDSAWMVHVLRRRGDIEIGALLTTINEPAERVAMHAVRIDLLRVQAEALGLPLWLVPIPSPCPNGVYEAAMRFRRHVERDGFVSRIWWSDWVSDTDRLGPCPTLTE